jgi:hypothetical protein
MLGAAALAVLGAGCEQPTIDCRATRGSFAAKFVLQSGSGTCSEVQTAIVGLQSYYAKGSDGKVDISKSKLAIRPENILGPEGVVHALIDEGCADDTAIVTTEFNSVGDFVSVDPDANGICSVTSATTARFVSNEIPASGDPMDMENACAAGLPAQDISYEWRNVKVHVSTAGPGNRFEADLTYKENGCEAQYKVCGVWPVVHCEKLDPNMATEEDPDGHTGQPENKLCDGQPDLEPQYAIPYGSGINTDFKPICDPIALVCVLPACPIPPQ